MLFGLFFLLIFVSLDLAEHVSPAFAYSFSIIRSSRR